LRADGLCLGYRGQEVVREACLELHGGEVLALVGPNGSGKSTTLRSVIGLVRPDAGVIEVCGHDVATDLREARRTVGVVLDPLQLFERLTAREFLATMGELREMDAAVARDRADELLDTLQLAGDAGRQIAGYSHGMRKKTALAAAVLHRPRLLLLDEPFEGVDPISARTMRAMLDRFRAGGGTIVLSSHVMDLVERLCDHIGVIHHGRVVAAGPTAELRNGRRLEDAFIDVVGESLSDPDALA
jgi:ABC-2 type transport system ATP-binding protein